MVRAQHFAEERQSSATDAAHPRGRDVSRGATPAADAEVEKASEAREAKCRSGAAAQRRSGAAAQRRSDAQALTTPLSNRSSRSKLTFALVRVSCEIQRSERARLLVAPGKARRPLPPLLIFAVACSSTTDGGTADLARVLRLAPADARFWAYCRAASRAVVDFSVSTGGKEGENRPVVCLIPG